MLFLPLCFWAYGSARDGHADLEERALALRQAEEAYGRFLGYKVKNIQVITPTVHLIFFSIQL